MPETPEPPDLVREADRALDGITPGPWAAEREHAHGTDIGSTDESIVDYVAVDVENRADALFIAAAPDLVRRLRDAYVDEFIAEDRAQQRLEKAQADREALVQALDGKVTTVIDRERDEIRARADRLAATVRKLAGWAGHDIADLIDEGFLQAGDLG